VRQDEPEPVVVVTTVRETTEVARRQRALWLFLLLVVALLVVGLFALARRGDEVVVAPATQQAPVSPELKGSGRLIAGNVSLLPLAQSADAAGSLSRFSGQQARADAVPVESVPADEGFWVGTSTTDRVWVQLTVGNAESPFRVEAGDRVSFLGTVRPAPPNFADDIGLTGEEGAQQLADLGQYIAVDGAAVNIS
jgi:hypothetical protein